MTRFDKARLVTAGVPIFVLLALLAVLPWRSFKTSGDVEVGLPAVPKYEFFDIRLTLDSNAVQSLRVAHRTDVAGFCEVKGSGSFAVSLRLKGDGAFQQITGKPSFTVKPKSASSIQSPAASVLFRNKFYLNNCAQDPAMIRDALARQIYRDLGIPAPKTAFASVWLNGRHLGFYSVAEGVGKPFLAQHLMTMDSKLFEGDRADVPENFGPPASGASNDLERWDRANLRAFVAAEYLTAHGDGFVGNTNNYFAYYRPKNGLLRVFPHTLDYAFQQSSSMFAQPARARILQQLVRSSDDRDAILQKLEEFTRDPQTKRINALANYYGTNLILDVAQRDSHAGLNTCREFEQLLANVPNYWSDLRVAVAIERGERDSTGWANAPERWRFTVGSNACEKSFSTVRGVISLRTEGRNELAVLDCREFLRPGAYEWSLPLESRQSASAAQKQEIRLAVSGQRPFTATRAEGRSTIRHRFAITNSNPDRLFQSELIRLQVQAHHFSRELHLFVGESRITFLSELNAHAR